jgi:hypothetical protein
MSTHTTARARFGFKATVQCEGCNQVFEALASVAGEGMASSGVLGSPEKDRARASGEAQHALQKKLDRIQRGQLKDLQSYRPCPNCGYIQSWMLKENRRQRREKAIGARRVTSILSVITIPITLFGAWSMGLRSTVLILVLVVVVACIPIWLRNAYFALIYQPNGDWLKAKGLGRGQAPAPRAPTALVPVTPESQK